MEEIWKTIVGYPNYMVSNMGNVKSLNYNNTGKEKLLKPFKNRKGYLQVALHQQEKRKFYYVHRLVAQHFIDNPNNLSQVNNPLNNCASNVEWCDSLYNNNYGAHKEKISKSNTNHPKISKQVLCVETGVVYPSIHQIERELGYNISNISKCCTGKRKTAYGYTWKYV